MKKSLVKLTAVMMALIMTVGMFTVFAEAYSTEDFTDVAPTHWAYGNIMVMADMGIVKGVGGGQFAPESGLKVAEFLAFIGRAMYPGDCAETAVWWETYYNTAVAKGLVQTGEYTTADMERSITRNEMARILTRTDEKVNGNPSVQVNTKAITDYNSIADEYKGYAAQAYAKGLLTGDTEGNFNGSMNLRRSEASTVIIRLLDAANKQDEVTKGVSGLTMTGNMITVKIAGKVYCDTWNVSGYTYPAGIQMTMQTADGRVLGSTVTYEYNAETGYSYTLEATIDTADFVRDQNVYYMVCTYISPDGTRYSNIDGYLGSGQSFKLATAGGYQIGEYDFSGGGLTFGVNNSPAAYLDF